MTSNSECKHKRKLLRDLDIYISIPTIYVITMIVLWWVIFK